MMVSNIKDISSYSFSDKDRLFLDANIWLSIYGPMVRKREKTTIYANAIQAIRKVGCPIFIDVLIISEFINTYARWEHKQSALSRVNFKVFRKNTVFKEIAKDIAINVRRIIKQCQCCSCNFTNIDIATLLAEFENGDSDFNDQIFCRICKDKNLTLITDDSDFGASDIAILTANTRLLRT